MSDNNSETGGFMFRQLFLLMTLALSFQFSQSAIAGECVTGKEPGCDMPETPGMFTPEISSNAPSAQARATCESVAKSTATACMTPGTSEMSPDKAAAYTANMNKLIELGSQVALMGKNMAAQCSLQADMNAALSAINGIKGTTCSLMIDKCVETCESEYSGHRQTAMQATKEDDPDTASFERAAAEKVQKTARVCNGYGGQVGGMLTAAVKNLGDFTANKLCEKNLSAAFSALPPLGKIGGCEDPNNQSLACFCEKTGNSNTAMCAGFKTDSSKAGVATPPNGTAGAMSPASAALVDANDGNTADPFASGGAKEKGGDARGPGDGGSGAPGGGGIAAFSSEGGSGGAGGDARSAITGTSGGTGSGLGSGGGGSGGFARNSGGVSAGKDGFFDKFNLKNFLPGSRYKTRGIAGMSVKSVDGITGPMGPSIWEKATRQYQEQIQKQNVILDK